MRTPVIVVTGGIGSGKTTIARIMAGRGGKLIDCDRLAREAYRDERLKEELTETFGTGILTRAGNVSRTRLARLVFSDSSKLDELNRLVKPHVKGIISTEVKRLRREAPYIVLDAVLYFQYTFRFKADLVVRTQAPVETRIKRVMQRDGITRREALMRIERQEPLEGAWSGADMVIETGGSAKSVAQAAAWIRDNFLEIHGIARRE
jgi:dephospho-CoA kinase